MFTALRQNAATFGGRLGRILYDLEAPARRLTLDTRIIKRTSWRAFAAAIAATIVVAVGVQNLISTTGSPDEATLAVVAGHMRGQISGQPVDDMHDNLDPGEMIADSVGDDGATFCRGYVCRDKPLCPCAIMNWWSNSPIRRRSLLWTIRQIFNISFIPAAALSIPLILLSAGFLTPLFFLSALRSVFKKYGAGAN